MPDRVLILFSLPSGPPEEADRWAQREADRLAEACTGTATVRLLAVEPHAGTHGDWDRLLELELAEGADVDRIARREPCTGLLGDLRLLGGRPTLLVVREG